MVANSVLAICDELASCFVYPEPGSGTTTTRDWSKWQMMNE